MSKCDPCPKCKADKLAYLIQLDAYRCRECGAEFDVLSVESDHVMYHGFIKDGIEYS